MEKDNIVVRGARHHNLKNIDIDIPKNKLVIITGLSGSGKSTLAFDTLYAEGQRRYVESLSTYARQFLGKMEKPDVDLIEGLSPAIAIEQKSTNHNPRSTVGTVTEIYDYLRLLYARIGIPHCPICGLPLTSQTIDEVIDTVLALPEDTRLLILSPLGEKNYSELSPVFRRLKKEGFARVRINNDIYTLDDLPAFAKKKKYTIDAVIDRLVVRGNIQNRLADSLELAASFGNGYAIIDVDGQNPIFFNETAMCQTCQIPVPQLDPTSFSFNSPQGACPKCEGLGTSNSFSVERIVPNPELSLREGAIAPWANRHSFYHIDFLDALAETFDTDIYTPFKKLPKELQDILLYGTRGKKISFRSTRNTEDGFYPHQIEGVIANLKRRYIETDSNIIREEISQYMNFSPCPACNGDRLKLDILGVTVGDINIADICKLSISQTKSFFETISLSPKEEAIAQKIIQEILDRLTFLENVGLTYLTLGRNAATLSGGESQRIRLATQIGSKLTGVLYVLDEPSIGLHPHNNQQLIETLTSIRDLGNTVLVVEHDKETILSSDYVIDMGPGAGVHGGEIVFKGTPKKLLKDSESLTGQYFSGRLHIDVPKKRRPVTDKNLILKGATIHNLQDVTATFPLGTLICITGLSGSGKSSLAIETLYKALAQKIYKSSTMAGPYKKLQGTEHIDKLINIDQSPIGRTPRSNPGTYTGVFTQIRELFSKTPAARQRGYTPGRFSFNIKGGRCEACAGDGILKIEMHFLPDVYVTCDVCHGKRYNRETLEVHYKGKTIADVLDMTVNQAFEFFENIPTIRNKLQTLVDVGLGYIRLGQSATTLSGGEAQRIKLARELSKTATDGTLYILDEPTTGLHMDDIRKLMQVLNRLVENGNTVIVIEHNMDVVKTADWIIDMGPEGGGGGGQIVASGTPEEIVRVSASYTGQHLKPYL